MKYAFTHANLLDGSRDMAVQREHDSADRRRNHRVHRRGAARRLPVILRSICPAAG